MNDYLPTESDLKQALDRLLASGAEQRPDTALAHVDVLPSTGLGQVKAASLTADLTVDNAQSFQSPGWFAHMDPPTPWITWTAQAFTAAMNQNLLHPDTGKLGGKWKPR